MKATHMFAAAALFAATALAPPARANEVDCNMTFSLKGWSAFYKTQSGTGTVSCRNGQRLRVKIVAKGGGLTFGKSSIENGKGEFTGIDDITDVLGSYQVTLDSDGELTGTQRTHRFARGEAGEG